MLNTLKKTDIQIQKDVSNELTWDPRLTATQLSVTATEGIVTLRGSVPHYFEKRIAEEAAQRVSGVRAVADEIVVKLLGSYERTDEDIARAALTALEWNYQVPKDVKVTVDSGWVTLRGKAEWDYQRSAARDTVSPLMGVRGVSNDITLKPGVQPSDIKTCIEDALKRAAEKEGHKIDVSVQGDCVTLSGKVHTFGEFADASFAAWNAPGVKDVTNNLKVAA